VEYDVEKTVCSVEPFGGHFYFLNLKTDSLFSSNINQCKIISFNNNNNKDILIFIFILVY
jgi:hypothetical protein